jgi:hypothetical protein
MIDLRREKSGAPGGCHQAPYHGLGQPNCRLEEIPGARVSALRGIGERVIRIAGIHKIGTAGAQQSFDLLDSSPNYAAWLAGLNLALQLEQAPIGAVETLRQDRCNVKERHRVCPEYGGRIGDVKLGGFQCTYVRGVRLIQQYGEFAEQAPGSVTLAISRPSFTTSTSPSLRISSRPVVEAARSTVSPAW